MLTFTIGYVMMNPPVGYMSTQHVPSETQEKNREIKRIGFDKGRMSTTLGKTCYKISCVDLSPKSVQTWAANK